MEISRVSLAAALLDYDSPELADGPLSARSAAQRSAVLAPFRDLLLPRPPPEQPGEDGTTTLPPREGPPPQSTPGFRSRSSFGSERTSLDLLNARQDTAAFGGFMEQQDSEIEERLADEWGLGSHFSQLGSGSVPTSPLGSPMPLSTLPLPFPSTQEDQVEAIETRSMPDLDRPRALSGATELDRSATMGGDVDGQPTRRIRILERRGSAARLRTQSLGDVLQLPSFGQLPKFDDEATPRASMDPLISPNARFSSDSTQGHRQSVFSLAEQTTADEPRVSSSSFIRPRTSLSTHTRPISYMSTTPAVAPYDATADDEHPFDETRPLSSLSMNPTTPTVFTSRFDPAMLAIAKQEIEKERPIFANKQAGAPPTIVLMPAPLAGRPPSPPRKIRKEGPDSDDEEELPAEEGVEESEASSQRPAGALYGRSLMDVMEERRALLKGRARHYVSGNGGSTTGEVGLEGRDPSTSKLAGKRNKSAMSVFGPDLFYQRDLERMRILEAQEAKEREEEEAREALVWEKERLKEENRRSGKGKLLKPGRKSVELSRADFVEISGRSPPTSPPAATARKGHTAEAPSLSLPALDLTASKSVSWLPAELQQPPSPASFDDHYRPPPVPERIPLTAASFAQKHTYIPHESHQKSSEEHAAALRNAVMMGTISPEEAVAEAQRLGLGSGTGSHSTQSDTRPLGERLTRPDSTSKALYTSEAPPQLRVAFGSEGQGGWDFGQDEANHSQGRSGSSPPSPPSSGSAKDDEDEDDLPLAFRASVLNSQRPGAAADDDDDLPLGVRGSMLAFKQDEDDRPLAFAQPHSHFNHQQYQAEQFYLNQQRQAEQAFLQAHSFNIATQQAQFGGQYGYGTDMGGQGPAGGAGSAVERWRRGVEG